MAVPLPPPCTSSRGLQPPALTREPTSTRDSTGTKQRPQVRPARNRRAPAHRARRCEPEALGRLRPCGRGLCGPGPPRAPTTCPSLTRHQYLLTSPPSPLTAPCIAPALTPLSHPSAPPGDEGLPRSRQPARERFNNR